jgi:tripartite-type tricarboxylate transporter receptor subunit TctC
MLPKLTRRAALALPLLAPGLLAAQPRPAWPDRPVRLLQGFAPGGGTDVLARLVAPHLAAALGQPMVVESRPGAGGTLAAEALARATDGHTLMMLNNGFAVSAALYRRLPYDPRADILPVAMVAASGLVLLVANTPEAPRDLAELAARARARPEALNLATVGVGSTQHFVAEAVQAAGDFRMTHVPYRGTPAALIALRNNEVQAVSEVAAAVLGQIRDGAVRALAITSAARSPLLPEVPTVREALGAATFEIDTWYAIGAPANTPEPVLARISAAVASLAEAPDLAPRLAALGLLLRPAGTPASVRATIHGEIDRWAEVIARTNIERQ